MSTATAMVHSEPGKRSAFNFTMVLWTAAALGLLFQVGHFFEHAFQFVVWCLGDLSQICGRNTPWISAWASDLVRQIGTPRIASSDNVTESDSTPRRRGRDLSR